LSRPNNRKKSYLAVISAVLRQFDDRFVLPIKQTASSIETVFDLEKLVPSLADPDESEYLREAVDCATSHYRKAAVVLGWCATIDKMQKKVMAVGFGKFNSTSKTMKAQTSGRFRRFNKEFSVGTLSELQEVFDSDLIRVLEGMGLLDGNQSERLIDTCFQYRNHAAHPGQAKIEDPHLVVFFTDINTIILSNSDFQP
jgi:hypothetical protein